MSRCESCKCKVDDKAFMPDIMKLEKYSRETPWMTEPKYFDKVRIAASAAIKMMTHAATGVEKGLAAANGMPIEVMGLLHGHIDTENDRTLVVTDAFPLPVEGTETAVVADDAAGLAYRTALDDNLEKSRGVVPFSGWYHSHPFDVAEHSNAFLSTTDVGTQVIYQNAVDSRGIPWLALVVDPLRGIAKGRPEIGAFRCYPPSYTPPKGMAPDGIVWTDEKARNARWGESCISYYQMEVEYYVPTLAASLLSIVARDFTWLRVLSSAPLRSQEKNVAKLEALRTATAAVDKAVNTGSGYFLGASSIENMTANLADSNKALTNLAMESCQSEAFTSIKSAIFNAPIASTTAAASETKEGAL